MTYTTNDEQLPASLIQELDRSVRALLAFIEDQRNSTFFNEAYRSQTVLSVIKGTQKLQDLNKELEAFSNSDIE